MKSLFHGESHALRNRAWSNALLVGAAGLVGLIASCSSSPPPFRYSQLSEPDRFAQRHEDKIDEFMEIQPPSYDVLVRRKWDIDKGRYSGWLEADRRRALAKRERIVEVVERQKRFFREYLRVSRETSVKQENTQR